MRPKEEKRVAHEFPAALFVAGAPMTFSYAGRLEERGGQHPPALAETGQHTHPGTCTAQLG